MSIKRIEEELKAIQLKDDALNDLSASFSSSPPKLIQFTKPRPKISVETPSEKNNGVEQSMLKYILEEYGKHGQNILSQREENLLPLYIEAYLLKQNFANPNGEFHTILQLIHEAAERTLDSRSPGSAIPSLK